MKLVLNPNKTKRGTQVSRSVRNKFVPDDSYSLKEQYFRSSKGKETKVYKVESDGRTIGIIPTDKFYYFFDYDHCCVDGELDTKKINGWFEEAHGARSSGISGEHPFTPPGGDWNVDFMAPSGSVLLTTFMDDPSMLDVRSFGQWSRKGRDVRQVIYSSDVVVAPQDRVVSTEHRNKKTDRDERYSTTRGSTKFANSAKLVGGSIDHPDQIMNISLGSMKTTDDQTIKHIYDQVQRSRKLGFVYARNRKVKDVTLQDLMSSMHDLDLNQKLMVFSCRGYDSGDEALWRYSFNEGPKLTELFDVEIEGVLETDQVHHAIVVGSGVNERQRLTSRLFHAYKKELLGEFKTLTENSKVDINYKLRGKSLLHYAVDDNKLAYAGALLTNDALEVDALNSSGNNALSEACGYSQSSTKYEMIELLLKAGSYELISRNGDKKVSLLLTAIERQDERLFDLAIKYTPIELLEERDYMDRTALILACEKTNQKMVDALISKGADPNVKGGFGVSPLKGTLRDQSGKMQLSLIRYLQTDLNQEIGTLRETVLHLAIKNNQQALIDELLTEHRDRVDLNKARLFGITPLAEAAVLNNINVMADLLTLGVDINHRSDDYFGVTALINACMKKQDEAIIWLLDHGAITSYKTTDKEPKTALDFYREAGGDNPEILSRLVVKPKPINLAVVSSSQPQILFDGQYSPRGPSDEVTINS
ncbi:ankyrin repeat domain-containing protein [Thiotrichales bacterium 19S3-7]|nr:ankyrin repeat domain-containing protein [Thiotrichales bacterium 19S3-7]MCF6802503.1 ankyrin repeat domain-containing protein [Thiotrichales bacterium 19S3-11]